jgi:hypothetical protein
MLRHEGGAVYVEFLLVFLPVFLLFLAVIQLGFVYAARLVVQHAANRAVRAAVVIIDDDPARYGGEPRGELHLTGSHQPRFSGQAYFHGIGYPGSADTLGGPRFLDIRGAAELPLLAVAPSSGALTGPESVRAAIGGIGSRVAAGSAYNLSAVAVAFPTAPGANTFRTRFRRDDLVTVRVSYVFHCATPLVSRLMCKSASSAVAGLSNDELAQIDVGYLSSLPNPRFLLVRGEATLRNQGVDYLYASEGGG